ncbi:MAG TPA: alpha/beta hydrolase family protein [Polyangiaceae bacterium]|nr:alpha/beta hydrolase family protein [Polyangiaceae bacterium]
MDVGRGADRIAGRLSHILHGLRGPKIDTTSDLGPYLDLAVDELFPMPPTLTSVRRHDGLASKVTRATTLSWTSSHEVLSPRYRSRHEHEYRANLTAWARWLTPDRTPRRECVVYVHGWLEPGSWVEEALVFPRWLRELDVDVVHVSLPFHGRRNPWNALFSGEFFWTADLVRSLEGIRQAIHDVRSITGWLRRQGYSRIGTSGISLGGSLVMLLACLPDPPEFIVPILCHLRLGDAIESAEILWRMKSDLERWGIDETRRRDIFSRLPFDSARPLLPPEKQLWIEAKSDGHIDPALVLRQWEDWHRPNLHWLKSGHMTFPLHLAEISGAIHTFLDEHVR